MELRVSRSAPNAVAATGNNNLSRFDSRMSSSPDVYAQVLVEAEPAPSIVREDPRLLGGGADGGLDASHLGEILVVGQLDGHPEVVDATPMDRTQPCIRRR